METIAVELNFHEVLILRELLAKAEKEILNAPKNRSPLGLTILEQVRTCDLKRLFDALPAACLNQNQAPGACL